MCQIVKGGDISGINGKVNENKTKLEIVVFSIFETQIDSGLDFMVLERERELILSRFSAVRTVGSRRSKK